MRSRCPSLARTLKVAVFLHGCSVLSVNAARAESLISLVNGDATSVGLNDATATAPVGGNVGASRGAQILNVLQHSADLLAARIHSDAEIVVQARFSPDAALPCGESWAVLASTSPEWACITDLITDHPQIELYYPGALCNRLYGERDPDHSIDILLDVNGNIGSAGCLSEQSWYLGLDHAGGDGTLDLSALVLHELVHGLGFVSFSSQSGSLFNGTPDVMMAYAYDNTQEKYWYEMSDAERAISYRSELGVVWKGPKTTLAAAQLLETGTDDNGHLFLHTPSIFEAGVSLSHLTADAFPNSLMEPEGVESTSGGPADLTLALAILEDIGWRDPGCNNGIIENAEACDNGPYNSDVEADACRRSCEVAGCGDGVADTGEECDEGGQNSFEAGHCRPNCTIFYCGDGIVDDGEECDDAGANRDAPDMCRLGCMQPTCGDGIVDDGEECDPRSTEAADLCGLDCRRTTTPDPVAPGGASGSGSEMESVGGTPIDPPAPTSGGSGGYVDQESDDAGSHNSAGPDEIDASTKADDLEANASVANCACGAIARRASGAQGLAIVGMLVLSIRCRRSIRRRVSTCAEAHRDKQRRQRRFRRSRFYYA